MEEMAIREGRFQPPAEVAPILEKYGKDTSPLTSEVTKDGQVIDLDLD